MTQLNKALISVIIAVIFLSGIGVFVGLNNLYLPQLSAHEEVEGPPEENTLVVGENSKNEKPKDSILSFTDRDGKEIGRLIIGDKISFQGAVDASGMIFLGYVSQKLNLECDFNKKQEKAPTQNNTETN